MDIAEIIRRWQTGQSIRAIKKGTGYDRETIGKYINIALSRGVKKDIIISTAEIKEIILAELPCRRPDDSPGK